MKDLIQEGREIQSKFKKFLLNESQTRLNEAPEILKKIAKFFNKDLVISFVTWGIDPKFRRNTTEYTTRLEDAYEEAAKRVIQDVIVNKHGGVAGGPAAIGYIELDGKSDSEIRRVHNIMKSCLQDIRTKNPAFEHLNISYQIILYKINPLNSLNPYRAVRTLEKDMIEAKPLPMSKTQQSSFNMDDTDNIY